MIHPLPVIDLGKSSAVSNLEIVKDATEASDPLSTGSFSDEMFSAFI